MDSFDPESVELQDLYTYRQLCKVQLHIASLTKDKEEPYYGTPVKRLIKDISNEIGFLEGEKHELNEKIWNLKTACDELAKDFDEHCKKYLSKKKEVTLEGR